VALQSFVPLFRAPDHSGILAAITPTLAAYGCETLQAHAGAPKTGIVFVRMMANSPLAPPRVA
jgi:formyltetrahydrofolate hydrolase